MKNNRTEAQLGQAFELVSKVEFGFPFQVQLQFSSELKLAFELEVKFELELKFKFAELNFLSDVACKSTQAGVHIWQHFL